MAFGTATTTYSPSKPVVSSRPVNTPHKPRYLPNPGIARLRGGFDAYAAKMGVTLTGCQRRFADAFFSGANVCLSGRAGTGKSRVAALLFEYLHLEKVSVGRTATTGVAALNIGGQTIHSWAGMGLADEDAKSIIETVKKKSKVCARIRATQVLFLDEVSMAKGDLLNKLDLVLKYVRRKDDPWGGVQVVAVGDFLQLPPVFKGNEIQEMAFECRAWRDAEFKTVVLNEPIRQQEGSLLLKVLNDVRIGRSDTLGLLAPRIGAKWTDSEIEPVRIFCKNVNVDDYNRERLAQLKGESKTYRARDSGSEYATDYFNKNCPAAEVIELKVGAQVMLLSNLDLKRGLCNGSLGVVKAFTTTGVKVKFATTEEVVDRTEWQQKDQEVGTDGRIRYKVVAERQQIPLRVAYATTVHKCQGMTLDRAVMDLVEAFAAGQIYVSLSRVRDLESLSLVGSIPAAAIRVNEECVRFYEGVENNDKSNA